MKARNRLVGAALFAASSLVLSGCSLDEILAVHVPGKVLEEALDNASLADVLTTGVVAEVECSWNQYVAGAAHHSDEYVPTSGNLTMRNWGQRKIYASDAGYSQGTCGGWGYPMFTPLHTARFQSEDVASRLAGFPAEEVSNLAALQATAATWGAFPLVAMGEGFCSMAIDGGAEMTPAQVQAEAEQRFSTAISLAQAAGDETLTRPGALPGTPGYMAPEVLRGDPVDARADQFSFGVLLHELVAGEHPFEGTDDITTVARILETEPSGLGPPRRECPEPLARVITTCLAKAPRDRYRTTAALVAALEAVRDSVEAAAADGGAAPAPGTASPRDARPGPASLATPAAAPLASTPPVPLGTDEDGGTANLRWWWQFHQVAVSVVYALMLYPVWRARDWLPAPWGLAAFMTTVAVVGAAVNLRLHLWFTSRVYPGQLAAQRRASALGKRLLDTAFAVLLLSIAAAGAPNHPRWAAFFIVMAISSALSARVMEPATTRAAFPGD